MSKAKKVESWGDIPDETFQAFYKAVENLREEMIPRDSDGDSPIEMLIVNRMTHMPIAEWGVPRAEVYSYITHDYLKIHPDKLREMQDDTEQTLTFNVQQAAEALGRYMRLKIDHNRLEREHALPIDDRIKEACEYCKKGVKFDPKNEKDHYNRTRAKYPDYPFLYHKNGEECKAFELWREVFNNMHPEYAGKPEDPKWCMNPECRCKLRNYDSKKGANDKYVCVNPRCGWDNSKFFPEPKKEVTV